jgi:nucleoside-diphosphate-sugar epimerase
MRILVTGASGFVGSHVVRDLRQRDHDVIATGRNANRLAELKSRGGSPAVADLSTDPLDSLVRGCDAIVHCAARASPWGRAELFMRDNVTATRRLIDAAREASTVKRFVFLSSPSIYYQRKDQFNLDESFVPPKLWSTHYAQTKWLSECAVREAAELGPVILRPRAVFGPRDTAIVPRLVAVAERGYFPLPAGGRAWTDLTYVDNLCSAIALALQPIPGIDGRVFNITNGEPVQFHDLLRRLFAAIRLEPRFVSVPRALVLALAGVSERIASLRPGKPEPKLTGYGVGLLSYSQTLSIEAARADLGYVPAVSLQSGLERFASWWISRDGH